MDENNEKKLFCLWFVAATVFGLLAEFVMLGYEWWQCRKYECIFDWEKARALSQPILWGCVLHYILDLFI